MPMLDFKCGTCDKEFEAYRSVHAEVSGNQDEPGPACPTCGGATTRFWSLATSGRALPDAVVVYQAPDGSYRFPGATDGASTAKYDRLGFQRIEARGWQEVRALEGRLNRHERAQMSRNEERRLANIEAVEKARRSEFYNGMNNGFRIPEAVLNRRTGRVEHTGRMITVNLSARGRDIARATIARNNAKGHRSPGEPGIHVDAYANSRSNRDESRRGDGKRYRD